MSAMIDSLAKHLQDRVNKAEPEVARLTGQLQALEKALHILATCHTRDDDLTGFVVEYVPSLEYGFEFTRADYIQAWKAVREHIHLQTEPKP